MEEIRDLSYPESGLHLLVCRFRLEPDVVYQWTIIIKKNSEMNETSLKSVGPSSGLLRGKFAHSVSPT